MIRLRGNRLALTVLPHPFQSLVPVPLTEAGRVLVCPPPTCAWPPGDDTRRRGYYLFFFFAFFFALAFSALLFFLKSAAWARS
jgi:hypothetical protein